MKVTVDIDILVTPKNDDRKIMQSIRIMSTAVSRIRKWNQLSQFRQTSTKVTPIKKTWDSSYEACNQTSMPPHMPKFT